MTRILVLAVALAACTTAPPPSSPPPPPQSDPAPPPTPVEPAPTPDPVPEPDPATPPVSTAKPDGASCLAGTDCASGICEGMGCGDATPGTCMPSQRGCTRDLRAYCGCDNKTFRGSGTCPGKRYSLKAACPVAP